MKSLISLAILLSSFSVMAQPDSVVMAAEVDRLDSLYGIAVKISDHPTEGYQRIATHSKFTWDSRSIHIEEEVLIYLYDENNLLVDIQFIQNPYRRPLRINRNSYMDSTGAEVPDTVAGAIHEYTYFYDLINNGANLMQTMKEQILRADMEGKFD